MTSYDIDALDEIETSDFETGNLSDEELEIPYEMIPPNPDDADTLPSQVHPSYPYGDPTRLTHPASFPRIPYDPTSRTLFEDASSASSTLQGLRWRDLALDLLLPVDPEKAEAARAALARKQASGTGNPAGRAQAQVPVPDPDDEFEDVDGSEEESDEDDDDDEEEEEDEDEGDEEEEEEEEDYGYVQQQDYMPPGYTHFFPPQQH
ncbi:hypothetical protein AURDEDRAFT_137666 [Auricularia subglabra TFB-10046 SS5]|nr:hypothetical protein AURDEDRAFT_137666 [Auricularia subglabra TFB-10046 SS5]